MTAASDPRWQAPQWYSAVLRELAAEFEDRMAQAARIHDKSTRARDMQTRENLKHCADYLDFLAAADPARDRP